jgi:purine nucleosidase
VGQPLRRVLLDTDLAMGAPGSDIDDGFALALAIADPDVSLELVTTVAGNTDIDTATRLSAELLAELGRSDVPVVQGAAGPLDPRLRRDDRPIVPVGRHDWASASPHAAVELVRRVLAEPGQLTIVAIGPLTNLALALQLEPGLADAVQDVVVMGGVYLGHTNVAAMPGEFNFWSDPHAASVVLQSGCPLRLVGLDVTRQVRLHREDVATLAAGGAFGRRAAEATEAWIDFQERVKPNEPLEHGSCALHDPLAMAVVTRPDLVTWGPARVEVERDSPVTRGVAIADLLMWEHPPAPNAQIAVDVDHEQFRALFLQRMAELP